MQKTIKQQKMVILILLSNIFIVFLGHGLIVPVIPSFREVMHLSGSTMGYLVAVFAVSQFILSPFAGRWVDVFGRKKIILGGLFLFGLSELTFGMGTELWVLYLSRILGGISAAFVMPGVTAYLADITSVQERGKAMGFVSAAISTGFIIGPGFGGFLAGFGVRVPFYVAAGIAILACIISSFLLKESLSKDAREALAKQNEQRNFLGDLKKSVQPAYIIPFLIVFVLAFGLTAYETVFSLFADAKFGYTPVDIALIITISGIVAVIFQLFLFGKLVDAIGEKRLIQICLIMGVLFAVCSTLVKGFGMLLLVTTLIFLAFDLLRPALTTFLSKSGGEEQGFMAGMNSAYTSLGNIAGPATAGILFDVHINYPYLFAAAILFIGLCITTVWREQKKETV